MKYSIIPTPSFKKEAKRLLNKYPSLKDELLSLQTELENNPETGTNLGNNTFKIRVAIKSKRKGKSGGARIITYLITADYEVYLLKIYDKSELGNISDKAIKELVQQIRK